MTFLYIVLFIVLLSILISIHELGHLTAAKIFKVYCFEFSIGFGPALIHKKKKTGETYFSLRAVPFGGYVSMYGEGVEVPEGLEIPPERKLQNIKKWKQAIIMVAGVTMNLVLALVIFYISNQACIHYTYYGRYVSPIQEGSIAYDAGLSADHAIYWTTVKNSEDQDVNLFLLDGSATLTYKDSSTGTVKENIAYVLNPSGITMSNLSYANLGYFYNKYVPEGKQEEYVDISNTIDLSNFKSATFTISNCDYVKLEDGTYAYDLTTKTDHQMTVEIQDGVLQDFGVNLLRKDEWYSFSKAVKQTFVDFGNASTQLWKGLGSLFTAEGWKQTGGIISIGVVTSNTLINQGAAAFFYLWGYISVNLAIVNLIPFPGLDGWHLLVIIVEGISRKKIPDKFKNIVSAIGLIILFAFMIMIVIKDIIGLF